jgi:dihydroxyacetone kinase-like predicted kinase
LAAAGVVDAGGRGLVVLLEALLTVVTERRGMGLTVTAGVSARPASALPATQQAGSVGYEYEVMYSLDGTDETRAATLRAELAGLGDCVAVVSSGCGAVALWKVHVHCGDAGAAIEAGIRAGRPHRITVLRCTDRTCVDQQDRVITGHVVLAMVSGSGLAKLFRGEGALTASSTSELLAVLAATRARHITVLASPAAATRIAAAHTGDTGQVVVVVPTASAVQALAAIAVHDAERPAADDLLAMTEAAAGTRRGELAVAGTAALTWVGRCQPGDVLGMVGDEVVLIDCDPLAAARGLAERMLSEGGELVTVLLGQHAPDGVGDTLIKHLRAVHPEVETVVYAAGVPDSMLLIGVE